MNRIDYNCFTGNWPFHKVRCNTIAKLSALHHRVGIENGIVSSLEAIFYQDPYEAEKALAVEIAGTGYVQAFVCNPTLPGWREDLRRAVKELSIRAVRLLPGFHGYRLTDSLMEEVAAVLRAYSLPLILTLRLEDVRVTWMCHPQAVELQDVAAFLSKYPDIPTMVANIQKYELPALYGLLTQRDNLFLDTSGLKDGLFIMEQLHETPVKGHLVYGSLAPLFELQSTALLVEKAQIAETDREQIFNNHFLNTLLF